MSDTEMTDNRGPETQRPGNFNPVLISIIVAVTLALASAYYVHVKNEAMFKTETNKAAKGVNHEN